jgi:hypothetical protein
MPSSGSGENRILTEKLQFAADHLKSRPSRLDRPAVTRVWRDPSTRCCGESASTVPSMLASITVLYKNNELVEHGLSELSIGSQVIVALSHDGKATRFAVQ